MNIDTEYKKVLNRKLKKGIKLKKNYPSVISENAITFYIEEEDCHKEMIDKVTDGV